MDDWYVMAEPTALNFILASPRKDLSMETLIVPPGSLERVEKRARQVLELDERAPFDVKVATSPTVGADLLSVTAEDRPAIYLADFKSISDLNLGRFLPRKPDHRDHVEKYVEALGIEVGIDPAVPDGQVVWANEWGFARGGVLNGAVPYEMAFDEINMPYFSGPSYSGPGWGGLFDDRTDMYAPFDEYSGVEGVAPCLGRGTWRGYG